MSKLLCVWRIVTRGLIARADPLSVKRDRQKGWNTMDQSFQNEPLATTGTPSDADKPARFGFLSAVKVMLRGKYDLGLSPEELDNLNSALKKIEQTTATVSMTPDEAKQRYIAPLADLLEKRAIKELRPLFF